MYPYTLEDNGKTRSSLSDLSLHQKCDVYVGKICEISFSKCYAIMILLKEFCLWTIKTSLLLGIDKSESLFLLQVFTVHLTVPLVNQTHAKTMQHVHCTVTWPTVHVLQVGQVHTAALTLMNASHHLVGF